MHRFSGTKCEHKPTRDKGRYTDMARYRFHSTNGMECVLDPIGQETRSAARLPEKARVVAGEVMNKLDRSADWREWQVSVHDSRGHRVLMQPFAMDAKRRLRAA